MYVMGNTTTLSVIDQRLQHLAPDFARTIDRVYAYCDEHRIDVRVTSPTGIAKALDLTSDARLELRSGIDVWINSLESASKALQIDGSPDALALRSYLENTGLETHDDFFSTIRSDDVIEIYRVDFSTGAAFQIWRNWEFLRLCSYDLLTILVTPMNVLFKRDEEIDALVAQAITRVIQSRQTMIVDVPSHVVTEQLHSHNRQFELKHRFAAPVIKKDEGRIIGFACTLNARLLKSAYADFRNVRPLDL